MKKKILKWRATKLFLETLSLIIILACICLYFYTWAHGHLITAIFCFLVALAFLYVFETILYMYRFNKEAR